ncbi:Uncharacterised protein [Klebsiella oxytoca]|nr:Uncharacterised protein [Klebsiella oxytoca]SBL86585.1 Uncharacterised protein [Klebsiella oxytoca]
MGGLVASVTVAEEVEHHRASPDGGNRIGDIFAVDIRRRTVYRLKQRRKGAIRVEVCRWGNADGARTGRAEIGKDIAEQIRADHYVKTLRLQHETGAQNINMLLIPFHLRVLLRHRFDALVPEGHADGEAVRFGRRGQGSARAALRQLKSVAQDAVNAAAGKHRLLNHHFMFGSRIHMAAKSGILPFGVFTNHVEIDIAGLFTRQRAGDAGEQAHRTQVDVLVEFAAELQQRAPEGDMIRDDIRPADRAEIDRIKAFQLRVPVLGHHSAVLGVIIAAGPLEVLEA